MRKILLFALLIALALTTFGQKLPFQGKLIETGIPVDGTRTLEFSIASRSWSETHTNVSITEGLYFVVLGSINPLPDSLFYSADELSLDISVDGTALSPVILFKPLSSPFEGSELNVKNDEGTIVGEMKAANYSFGKNGEIIVNGTNGLENVALAGFSHWQTPGNNYGALRVSNDEGDLKASLLISPYRGLHGSGEFVLLGDSTSSLASGFNAFDEKFDYPYFSLRTVDGLRANIDVIKSDTIERGRLYVSSNINESISIQPHGWFAYKDGIQSGLFQSQNWGGQGVAGNIQLNGPYSRNFELSNKHWVNPDLPWFKMVGSQNQDVIQISVSDDSTESAYMNLFSSVNKEASLYSTGLRFNRGGTDWREFASINVENTDGYGDAGYFSLSGPNTGNIWLGTRSWEGRPDLPVINLHGENDFHGIELSITRDEENNQFGWINLMSENGKNIHLSPEGFGVEGVSMSTIEDQNGNFGSFTLHGPNTDNFQFMPGWWDQPDLPRMLLLGTSQIAAVDMGAELDGQQNEVGFIGISSTDGSSAFWRPGILALNNTNNVQTIALETINNGQGEFGQLRLNGPNGNPSLSLTNSGGAGWLTVFGVTGGGIKSGFKWWEGEGGENRPFHALEGTVIPDFGLIYSHIIGDNTVEHGQIELHSTNGSRTEINAYELTFNDTEQELTYNAGGISGTGPLNIGMDLTVNGTVTETSDRRFKKNIQPLQGSSLQKIELIEGVSYYWRQDEFPDKNFSSDKQMGVIAQDLEAQFPALVKTDKKGYKSVNYNGFTAVLLEAVKELNAKVEKLESENMQLRAELSSTQTNTSEISQLKEQMEALVKMVQNQQSNNFIHEEPVSTPGLK